MKVIQMKNMKRKSSAVSTPTGERALKVKFGEVLVENANSLTFNTRNYFGPVDIERVEVKLMDDKGNLVQLNGSEWSFSIITTQLYQY